MLNLLEFCGEIFLHFLFNFLNSMLSVFLDHVADLIVVEIGTKFVIFIVRIL